jgi:methionyl aminopeptidase
LVARGRSVSQMIEILNSTELPRAREAGALVAGILQTLKSRCEVGTNLRDINLWARAMITEAGAQSSYVDYEPSFGRGPFGHYICTSVNAARPGARIGDISHAIGAVLSEAGYRINTEFGGHGVGSTMHQEPHVPNFGRPGRGYRLRPGLVLALEPWVMADTAKLVTDTDGWTLRSATGCRTAHSEHTIAITNDGAEVLTLSKQAQP